MFKIIQPNGKNYPSAKALAERLEGELITENYEPVKGDVIINYGNSKCYELYVRADWNGVYFYNHPCAVENCVNKRLMFAVINESNEPLPDKAVYPKIYILESTEDPSVAYGWHKEGATVVVRNLTCSSQGKGIEVITPNDVFDVLAPLYTKYFPATHEFRIHVSQGVIIDYVQKKRMGKKKLEQLGLDKPNEFIRSHSNGWVFARKGVKLTDELCEQAILAVEALGLDYGAVDILAIFDGDTLVKSAICEVNTAPGLAGETTFTRYVEAFEEMYS